MYDCYEVKEIHDHDDGFDGRTGLSTYVWSTMPASAGGLTIGHSVHTKRDVAMNAHEIPLDFRQVRGDRESVDRSSHP